MFSTGLLFTKKKLGLFNKQKNPRNCVSIKDDYKTCQATKLTLLFSKCFLEVTTRSAGFLLGPAEGFCHIVLNHGFSMI